MSKYDELVAANTTDVDKYYQYKRDCFDFAKRFTDGLFDYLGVSWGQEGEVSFFRPSEQFDPNSQMTSNVYGGMNLEKDGYYQIAFALDVQAKSRMGKHNLIFRIFIRLYRGIWTIKLSPQDEPIQLTNDANLEREFEDLYEKLFAGTKKVLISGFDNFLSQQEPSGSMGFEINRAPRDTE